MSRPPGPVDPAPAGAADPIRVLLVDDSAVARQAVRALLAGARDLEVATAPDPIVAMARMAASRPGVIILDLEMPRMDGLTFLRKIMAEDPIPVVVFSALTGPGTDLAMRALEEGAVSVVAKPGLAEQGALEEAAAAMRETVRAAARARLRRRSPPGGPAAEGGAPRAALPAGLHAGTGADRIVALGASTGGTEALREVLGAMPPDCPPLGIVQHMPGYFTAAFARRLDELCRISVREARDGDRLLPGQALIAPGDQHMRVVRDGSFYRVVIENGPLVCGHRPSVDVLFRSMAQAAGSRGVGVLLTGMGEDGAEGLAAMRRAGAHTIAQDEATCVVFGMPREAIRRGAASEVAPLSGIPRILLENARGPRPAAGPGSSGRRSRGG